MHSAHPSRSQMSLHPPQGGCNTSASLTAMPYQTCRLYAMPDCMLVPPVHERGAWIKRLVGEQLAAQLGAATAAEHLPASAACHCSRAALPGKELRRLHPRWLRARPAGFPLRQGALDVPGFSTSVGQGMRGGELPECPGTVIPGGCAFTDVMDAVFVCLMHPDCNAMVVYEQGGPACGELACAVPAPPQECSRHAHAAGCNLPWLLRCPGRKHNRCISRPCPPTTSTTASVHEIGQGKPSLSEQALRRKQWCLFDRFKP